MMMVFATAAVLGVWIALIWVLDPDGFRGRSNRWKGSTRRHVKR